MHDLTVSAYAKNGASLVAWKLSDDATLASVQIPGVTQRGNWFSAYDVSPRDLVEIIRIAPAGEIALLEVSIDLFPARGTAPANAPHQIVDTFLALQRRHA